MDQTYFWTLVLVAGVAGTLGYSVAIDALGAGEAVFIVAVVVAMIALTQSLPTAPIPVVVLEPEPEPEPEPGRKPVGFVPPSYGIASPSVAVSSF
jgi:hypothetical protein